MSRFSWLRALRIRIASFRPGRRRSERRTQRPFLEHLERRLVPTTFTVTNTNDSGAGSLRQAIIDANGSAGVDTIDFNIAGAGVHIIAPALVLPTITGAVFVDGYTQSGASGNTLAIGDNAVILIQLKGTGPAGFDGLTLGAGVSGSNIRGLSITNFADGINLNSPSGNQIDGNFIGLDADGTTIDANQTGVTIQTGAQTNGIGTNGDNLNDLGERNIIAGNVGNGVLISGAGTNGNSVAGNYIGLDINGNPAANGAKGVLMQSGAQSNRIGTDGNGIGDAAEQNVIASNGGAGVVIGGLGTNLNIVAGNYIGTDPTGVLVRPNDYGVQIDAGPQSNRIGTDGNGIADAAEGNVISANNKIGVDINGVGTNSNVVAGNFIGTNAAGTAALPNAVSGVGIRGGAQNNRVGTDGSADAFNAAERNIVSGNTGSGVFILGGGTTGNVVAGNYIGADVSGLLALPNVDAVQITGGAQNNIIGTNGDGNGFDATERNVLSGNSNAGVLMQGAGTQSNIVAGNYIGVTALGTAALGNLVGVQLANGASGNRIGTDANGIADAAERNIISGNADSGVEIAGGATSNVVASNYIGTNAAGTGALANNTGIVIGGSGNLIGTNGDGVNDAAERNVISGNTQYGVDMNGATNNKIAGNYIGTNAAGDTLLQNGFSSVATFFSTGNVIGTSGLDAVNADDRNIISGGVILQNANIFAGNYVGLNAAGTASLGATFGVQVSGTTGSRVGTNGDGSADAAERNVISGINGTAILVSQPGAVIAGNYIGTDPTGASTIPNQRGIQLGSSVTGVRIGTNADGVNDAAEGNVISGNSIAGVQISVTSNSNVLAGNTIGLNAAGTAALANADGVLIDSGSSNNTIGGNVAGAGNVVSGNTGNGVTITDSGTTGNVLAGNIIGLNAAGTAVVKNTLSGVLITSGASGNRIGTDGDGVNDAQERNVISGNASGIHANVEIVNAVGPVGPVTNNNIVAGNYIGLNAAGTATVLNSGRGVRIAVGASFNRVGTDGSNDAFNADERNVISGINSIAVFIAWGVTDPNVATGNVVAGNWIGLNAAGTASLGNPGEGIDISGSTQNRIGTNADGVADAVEANVVVGSSIGVDLSDAAQQNVVAGNFIGTNPAGTAPMPNAAGVLVDTAAIGNTIGGTTVAARNIISGNTGDGIEITKSGTSNNVIAGNYIGADVTGATALANTGFGVVVDTSASANTIGGASASARNVISGNGKSGVSFNSGATLNVVAGNYMGADFTGALPLPNAVDGVALRTGATNNTIGGLTAGSRNIISGNAGAGVDFTQSTTSNNVVEGNYIGANVAGTGPLPNLNGVVIAGATNNTIGGTTAANRNIISGNHIEGVNLNGVGTTGNVVLGNYIGTDTNGTAQLGNISAGVLITNGATGNTVGGTAVGAGNVVSANGNAATFIGGVYLTGVGTSGNVVAGNLIGTDKSGLLALGNNWDGVGIEAGASGNTIGGTAPGARNVISANAAVGAEIDGAGSSANIIAGNYIGTDITGAAALGNTVAGVLLRVGAIGNTVGGATPAARNVISGNTADGVLIRDAATTGNVVLGNYIGTNAAGLAAIPNTSDGVAIASGANGNTIGGIAAGARNVISGNAARGVMIQDAGTSGNVVEGNYIGTDISGLVALSNNDDGVLIFNSASGNTVGGTATGARNVLSANSLFGVYIAGSTTTGNVVEGNYIGTDVSGSAALGNIAGVVVGGASNNTIGGTTSAARNVISGNLDVGVDFELGATGNVFEGNYVGTDATGASAIGNGNGGSGITIPAASDNIIGGTTAGARNVISGNSGDGVDIGQSGTTGNVIAGNFIGTNAAGTAALANGGDGVRITNGAASNTIGGTASAARNIISGNAIFGVDLIDNGTSNNLVAGNYVGTDVTGSVALGNGENGVIVEDGASNNLIGGSVAGARNVISGNVLTGVAIVDTNNFGTLNNLVQGNYVGTDAGGTLAVPNQQGGVYVYGTSNTIGGTTPAARNIISGNAGAFGGVILDSLFNAGLNNVVEGNFIGTDFTGTLPLGNSGAGVLIFDGASSNTIGGTVAGAGNVIAANVGDGVAIENDANTTNSGLSTGNVVQGNFIGLDASTAIPLGNTKHGVSIRAGASGNVIGGTSLGAGNFIAFSLGAGVAVTDNSIHNAIRGNSTFQNVGLGIDLGDNGVTVNTPGGVHLGAGPNDLLNFPVLSSATISNGDLTFSGLAPLGTEIDLYAAEPSVDGFNDVNDFGQGKTYLGTFVVTDPTTGTYGPKPFQGVTVGQDTSNHFTFTLPLPSSFTSDTKITTSATAFSETSEFGNNITPTAATLSLGLSQTVINEGDSVTLTASFPVNPAHSNTAVISWGDGESSTVKAPAGVNVINTTHRYRDDNPSGTPSDVNNISVTVTDDSTGATLSGGTSLTVNNVPPTVRIVSDLSGASATNTDGSVVSLAADVSDPGVLDTFTYLWTVTQNGVQVGSGTAPTFTIARQIGAVSVVTLTVTDDDTGVGADTASILALTPNNDALTLTDTTGTIGNVTFNLPAGANRLVVYALGGDDKIDASARSANFPVELNGGLGNDTLIGGAGDDVFDDGHGNDNIQGNGGGDLYQLTPGSADIISELSNDTTGTDTGGIDTVSFKYAEQGVSFSLGAASGTTQTVTSAGSTFTAYGTFENLTGSSFADSLTGSNGDNTIFGGVGADTIDAGTGNDIIFGDTGTIADTVSSGANNDVIFGGVGADTIDAGSGNDLIFGDTGTSTDTVPSGTNNDIIFGGVGADTIDAGSGNDVIFGDTGTSTDTVPSGTNNDVIFGGVGADTIDAGSGNDVIFGDTGTTTDTVPSGTNNDLIFGGVGADTIDAGSGNDVIFGDTGTSTDTVPSGTNNDVIFGGVGADTIDAGSGNDVIFGDTGTSTDTVPSATNNDIIFGGVGADTIDAGNGNDVIFGDTGTTTDTVPSSTNNDIIFGGVGADTIDAGAGNDIIFGDTGTTADTVASGTSNDVIFGGVGADTIDSGAGNDVIFGDSDGVFDANHQWTGATITNIDGTSIDLLTASGDFNYALQSGAPFNFLTRGTETKQFREIEQVSLNGGSSNNLLDASLYNGPVALNGGAGNDTLLGGTASDTLDGGAGNDSLAGGAGDDAYIFDGSNLGADTVNEAVGGGADTLDFRAFTGGPISLDLGQTAPQTINPGNLSLTLTSGNALENVFGSSYDDVITGNAKDNLLLGGGGRDSLVGVAGNDTLQAGATEDVYLDFDTFAAADKHFYIASERTAILNRLVADYAAFNYVFTLTPPTGGDFVTIFFNKTPNGNQPEIGGLAGELDWRNVSLGGSVAIDDNYLLRAPAANTSTNFVALSATIAGHELGHLSGLRHTDSFGPIGSGIFASTDTSRYITAAPGATLGNFAGSRNATETPFDLMASPGSVGIALTNSLGDPYLGERDAVKLAFADAGSVVFEQSGAHQSVASAQPLTLAGLSVPNTLAANPNAQDFGQTFAVKAADIVGHIGLIGGQSASDFYSFAGTAGTVMNFETMSASLTRNANPIDTILRLRDPNGVIIATDDDGIEPTDALLIDATLPVTGTYTIEVDVYSDALTPHTSTGDYELLMYSFARGSDQGQGVGDSLIAGTGDDTLIGSSVSDTYIFGGNTLRHDTIKSIAGNGQGTLDFSAMATGIAVDLASILPQTVGGGLMLTLPSATAIKTVIGTPFNDTILGNSLDNVFTGGAGTNVLDGRGGNNQVVESNDATFDLSDAALSINGNQGVTNDSLTNIQQANLKGGALGDTFTVHNWTGSASLDGGGSGDTYNVDFNGVAGSTTIHDSGTDNATDSLTVHAFSATNQGPVPVTASLGGVTIGGGQVVQGAETVKYDASIELVNVNNVQAGVDAGPDAIINEGDTFTQSGSTTYPNADHATVDYGDPSGTMSVPLTHFGNYSVFTLSHIYADNRALPFPVTVTMFDINNSLLGSDAAAVTVRNVAPIVVPPANQTAQAGATANFNLGSFSDPGLNDAPWSVVVNWGDNTSNNSFSETAQGSLGVAPHTYTTDGNFLVSVTVTDKDLGSTISTFHVLVAPTIALSGAASVNEGSISPLTLGSIGNTPLSNTVTGYAIHWGDGQTDVFNGAPTLNAIAAHTYADGPNNYVITVDLTTQQGFFANVGRKSVAVNNVAPVVTLAGATSVNEGSAYALTLGPVTDPGKDTIKTFTINWGDGIHQTVFGPPSNVTRTHVYADGPNNYTITVDATDEDGTYTNIGFTAGHVALSVAVNNVPPKINVTGVGHILEGSLYTLYLGTVSDPGHDTVSSYTIHWGDGTNATFSGSASGAVKTHTFDDGPRTWTVAVDLTDEDGTYTSVVSKTIAVDNVAPTAVFANNGPVFNGAPVTVSFTSPLDPSLADTTGGFHYSYALTQAGLAGDYGSAVTASTAPFTFANDGAYTIYGRILDKDNGFTDYQTVAVIRNVGILLLDRDDAGALTDSGNGSIVVSGSGIVVDSTNPAAAVLSGKGSITATELDVTGVPGTRRTGQGQFNTTIVSGKPPLADPLAGLPAVPVPSSVFGGVDAEGNANLTLQPGVYVGGIQVNGKASVSLQPGIYYLRRGGLEVSGQGSVTGAGVLIYASASDRDDCEDDDGGDGIRITGSGSVWLTAQTSGTYQGIVLFQSRHSGMPVTISGNGNTVLNGAVYGTRAVVSLSGNALLTIQGHGSQLIANDLTVSGNASLSVQAPATSLVRGQSASVNFWQGKGQKVITSLNGGAGATAVGTWLASSFPNLFGNLAGHTNTQVAQAFAAAGNSTYQQAFAAALNIYATTSSLGGASLVQNGLAAKYGFKVTAAGSGAATLDVGADFPAFDLSTNSNTVLTVLQVVQKVDAHYAAGVFYAGNATLTAEAANVLATVNAAGAINLLAVGDGVPTDGSAADTAVVLASITDLFTGQLWVTVTDAGGMIAGEGDRIADAIAELNSQLNPYGITMVEVSGDAAANADITIHIAATSEIGGVADGVLGVTSLGRDVTLVAGWNWYVGGDATGISSGQYDFQTVATHELGHALGLGHSAETASVMYPYLAALDVRRSLTAGDLAVIDQDANGPEALHAAPPGNFIVRVDAISEAGPRLDAPGNGVYQGSGGGAVLLGGAGDDLLIGGPVRAKLVGGFGREQSALQRDDATAAAIVAWHAQEQSRRVDTISLGAVRGSHEQLAGHAVTSADAFFAQNSNHLGTLHDKMGVQL